MANYKIDRENLAGLIPEEIAREIITGVRTSSVAMQLMRRLPNMSTRLQRMPVLSLLPQSDFVNGDAGMKITTNVAWKDKILVVGEIATIVPIPQAVLDDSDYDIWGEVRPLISESMGRTLDQQIFNGGNPKAPIEWPPGLIPAAIAAGNQVTTGTGIDILDDVNNMFGLLEEQGYDVTGFASQKGLRTKLRGLRDNNNGFLFGAPTSGNENNPFGIPMFFVGEGTWDARLASAIAGDWTKSVYSIRQDMTFQIFDTGVISDDEGKVVYNLLQQDMIAMRAVMRIAWQVANPINIDRTDIEGTFPFAILKPSA